LFPIEILRISGESIRSNSRANYSTRAGSLASELAKKRLPVIALASLRIDPLETGAYQSLGREFSFADACRGFTRRQAK
jgi:hypothetical protein